MSAELRASLLEAPVDPLTGVGYPIYFTPEQLLWKGRDHHPNHYDRRPELADAMGRIQRYSRVYWTPDHFHFEMRPHGYHRLFGSSELQDDADSKFRVTALQLARVIPRMAFDLRERGGYSLKPLDDEEHELFASSRVTHIEQAHKSNGRYFVRNKIGHNIIRHALDRVDLTELLSSVQRNNFLESQDPKRIKEIGNLAIYRAVDEVARPLHGIYEEAREEGMVRAGSPEPRDAVRKVLPINQLGIHYDELKKILNPELAIEGADTLQTEADKLKLQAA